MTPPGHFQTRRWRARKPWIVIGGLALILMWFPPPSATAVEAPASVTSEETFPADAALGFASFLATIPYGAAKIGYAITGAVAGGLEYLYEGRTTPAVEDIWDSALGGTYILTPDHLRGKKEISFIGKTKTQSAPQGP